MVDDEIREVRKITLVGMIFNVILSLLKIIAGTIGNSQTIIADGIHSISDTFTDMILLIGVRYWSAPPDSNHPHGHRRIETMATVAIGLILVMVASGIAYNAIISINEEDHTAPDLIALIAALVSIFVKEILYRWNLVVGNRLGSSSVIANAFHHRSDGISSIPAAIAVAGSMFFPQFYFLDNIGAIVVSIFIFQMAYKIMWPAAKELTDHGADLETCERIEAISLATDGVRSIHKCRTRFLGLGLQVDLHIQVDPLLSVQKGHDISRAVKQRLMDKVPVIHDVITHLEPYYE